MLLYISPDTIMPLASALAAVVGVIVMFWQKVKGFCRSLAQAVASKFGRTPGKSA
jgi:hypothetical protein